MRRRTRPNNKNVFTRRFYEAISNPCIGLIDWLTFGDDLGLDQWSDMDISQKVQDRFSLNCFVVLNQMFKFKDRSKSVSNMEAIHNQLCGDETIISV